MRVVFQNHIAITFIKQFVKTRIEELTFLFDNSVVWKKNSPLPFFITAEVTGTSLRAATL